MLINKKIVIYSFLGFLIFEGHFFQKNSSEGAKLDHVFC